MQRLTNLWAGLLVSATLMGCTGETPKPGESGAGANNSSGTNTDAATGGGDVQLGDPGNIELGTPSTPPSNEETGTTTTGTGSPADAPTEGPVLPAPKEIPVSP